MMKSLRRSVVICLTLLVAAGLVGAQGKKDKDTQLRTVRGVVADKSDKPVQNAVVFLKNLRTNVVISHFTDADGSYRFTGLDPNIDYEVHAESGGDKSATRTATSLDNRKEVTMNLKLDRKKN